MKNNRLPRRVKRAIAVLQGYCEKHDDCDDCRVSVISSEGEFGWCPLKHYTAVDWLPEVWEERK